MADLNLGRISMGDHDLDWFLVMCRLRDRSIRANVANVLSYYVQRRKKEYEEMLSYTARKYGLTESELFHKLLNNEELGEPVEDFYELPPEMGEE
ncbi:MAG: hypothetical protein AB4290_20610 [Spirulina sp.]